MATSGAEWWATSTGCSRPSCAPPNTTRRPAGSSRRRARSPPDTVRSSCKGPSRKLPRRRWPPMGSRGLSRRPAEGLRGRPANQITQALGDAAHRVRLEEGQDLVQPIQLDGLAHEIGRAQLQALARLALVDDARDGHDRDAERPHRAELEEVEPAHTRQLDVEKNRVESFGLQRGQRGFGGMDDEGMVTELDEKIAEHIAEVDLVLDYEHPHLRFTLAR